MPHLPLAMWYFRGSATYLREYVDLVNHNLCVEMTIFIGHCLRGLAQLEFNHQKNRTILKAELIYLVT